MKSNLVLRLAASRLGWTALLLSVSLPALARQSDPTPAPPVPPPPAAPAEASANAAAAQQNQVVIERIEPDSNRSARPDEAWLGLGTEEASEALSVQLGLKPGEGLVVAFVAPDSPAAKAGFQKNDVVVSLDGQMLVLPAQFRKLVQMHRPGEQVTLEYIRAGKQAKADATLGKTSDRGPGGEPGWPGQLRELKENLDELNGRTRENLHQEMRALHDSLSKAGVDREQVRIEIRRSLEEARRAAETALRQASNQLRTVSDDLKPLEQMAHGGVDLDNKSTVVIRRDDHSVQTQVKTDESGTYVIVANPKMRLTAHDADGKLLFDGPIDTSQEQAKVPKDVWHKVQPMLEQMNKPQSAEDN
ncbi:MAG TPA: PDZ domain-containing protein [Verrucomicrobiae bacterium]|nr:PDZ domain-containing protein [Verrucomicrobiae bacterium]